MKKYLFFIPLLFAIYQLKGQQLDFEQLIPPTDQKADTFEDFLVQLAWLNTPTTDALQYERRRAEIEMNTKKFGWSQAVGVSFGFNQSTNFVNTAGGGTETILFPRVSIGASLNLHPLFTTPGNVKMAKETLKIADANIDQEKLRIRKETLQRYQRYLLAIEVLEVRTNKEEDASATHELMSQLFKNSEVTFEEYNKSYSTYHDAVEDRLEAGVAIKITQIDVEELIGIDLEEAKRLFGVLD